MRTGGTMPANNPKMPATGPDDAALNPRSDEPGQPPGTSAGTVSNEHEGATDEEVGDRTGPRAGYEDEPEQEVDGGGVA
jgi:hypothetical protein